MIYMKGMGLIPVGRRKMLTVVGSKNVETPRLVTLIGKA